MVPAPHTAIVLILLMRMVQRKEKEGANRSKQKTTRHPDGFLLKI